MYQEIIDIQSSIIHSTFSSIPLLSQFGNHFGLPPVIIYTDKLQKYLESVGILQDA